MDKFRSRKQFSGFGSQVWSLLSLGVTMNLTLWVLVSALRLPLYLDSLGTVLVGLCAGPAAGALTGCIAIAVQSLTSPTSLPFLPVACLVGALAGLAGRTGVLKSVWRLPVYGAAVGCLTAAVSAPIAAAVFGGVTGGGTDLLVALFRAEGRSAVEAVFLQSILVDPADKLLTFSLAGWALRSLPRRSLAAFPVLLHLAPVALTSRPYRTWPALAPGSEKLAKPVPPAPGGPHYRTGDGLLHRTEPTFQFAASVLSVLFLFFCSDPAAAAFCLISTTTLLALGDPTVTFQAARRALPFLLPLATSMVLIQGLFGGGESVRWGGVAWSSEGLSLSILLLCRVAVLVLLSLAFLCTTALERFAEVLLKFRVPFPVVFSLVTAVTMLPRLRERLRMASLAAQARGLPMNSGSWVDRWRQFRAILGPTLGSLFAELPERAANLESRGFLSPGRPTPIPKSWSGELTASPWGSGLYGLIVLVNGWGLVWPYI